MMSEKRFVLKFDSQENEYFIRDNFEEEEELGSYTLKWGVRKLNEQQSIIEQLQDLCGESDYENAKLRLKNKELQDKIDWLCEKYDYPNNKGCEK